MSEPTREQLIAANERLDAEVGRLVFALELAKGDRDAAEKRAQTYYERCGEYAASAVKVDDLVAVVQEYRDIIHRSNCLCDGSVPDRDASRDIQRLDGLLARAKPAAARGGHDGDQAASSSSPSEAGIAGGADVA